MRVAHLVGLLFLSLSTFASEPFELPSEALIITHATRRYESHGSVIQATLDAIDRAVAQRRPVYALGDEDIYTDPRWYAYRDSRITRAWTSASGEHPFFPVAPGAQVFNVEVLGGYHCACLGQTLVQLIARFLSVAGISELNIDLPMRAIYTGYLLSPRGTLIPATPREEANADDSVDGESLEVATQMMSDAQWADFMMESLRLSVFSRRPLWLMDLSHVSVTVSRKGVPVRDVRGASPAKLIRFRYH